WGTKYFVRYYLLSGIGAGVCISLLNWYLAVKGLSSPASYTIGASGAVYALLLAYGILWPNREALFMCIIPVKMKYLVIFFGIFEFFGTIDSMSGSGSNISHIGHIGGLLTGFLILKISSMRRRPSGPSPLKRKESSYIAKLFRSFKMRRKRKVIKDRIRAKETIDILLDKIAHHGMESLTPEERKDLEWARKNYYPTGNETIH
ncbi:MAG: rhomboid family intramembrane serine protease, partial [Spirochaetota bacterium]